MMTEKEKKRLNKHKAHHTKKHMRSMRMLMKEGTSFTQAHNMTMKKIGK
tara:strand:+ start:1274 stop:1420 length:147 start_codon:yes stop_codon:yes gene_type:complete